jgi:hypothetical protein
LVLETIVTTLLQDLHQKLQAAQLDLEAINNNEALLEFPVTVVPTLPALIQLIEPYYQLCARCPQFPRKSRRLVSW